MSLDEEVHLGLVPKTMSKLWNYSVEQPIILIKLKLTGHNTSCRSPKDYYERLEHVNDVDKVRPPAVSEEAKN